ncbi:hypothetical protein MHW47_31080 [Streptomyces sp. OfavH-34-F]|uniref:hypothetical protein n=1 Tax=Streptomyces sp. OfavH-34-F TaxID=2917760 RepID=UPI001EF1AF52|nr:hypothetical protein [Streptomyces sp. OfavH-34-F]MCG7528870.1 hypothetical protein [Streptomyces sp. OfavH-34-F]
MNATSAAVAGALTFLWLGMVLAISFLEAPLKFRAPGVTIPIGLGIGRMVFRALNRVEIALTAALILTIALGDPPPAVIALLAAVALLLTVQLVAVRRPLNRRSDRVLAGEDLPRSRGHVYYVAFEIAKVAALMALGITLATA